MGLAQKRIIQELQTVHFPNWNKQVAEALGFEIPLEVKWETIEHENYEDKDFYIECMNKVYFLPLVAVFKNICQDDMGKDALKANLKKIVINGKEGISPSYSKFENGSLNINHEVFCNVDEIKQKTEYWTKMLEKAL